MRLRLLSFFVCVALCAAGEPCVPGCGGQASHCKQCSAKQGLEWSCDVCCPGCIAKSEFGGQFCYCTGPTPPPVPTPAPTQPPCTVPTCSEYPIAGPGAVAYRNNCTAAKCPLLIMLHGAGGDGEKMAADSSMHDKFNGIVAYPSSLPFATGWPVVNTGDDWASNMQTLEAILSLPDVDATRVAVLGFSSGGFYSYALACDMGDRLRAAVVISALKYVQPSCPHHTNLLHVHSAHDNYNVPTDPPNGTKPGGLNEIGTPRTLRDNWLDGLPPADVSTNGPSGASKGSFTRYTARLSESSNATQHKLTGAQGQGQDQGDITFDYWSYLDGPSRHAYMVYDGSPGGAPGGVGMEDFIAGYLNDLM